jgi:hypothetical protein
MTVDPNPNFDSARQEEKERWNLTVPAFVGGIAGRRCRR